MNLARFAIVGRLDGVEPVRATITIDRERGLFTVRPLYRQRVYTLPLATVAEMVVARVVRAEVENEKPRKRQVRRGLLRGT